MSEKIEHPGERARGRAVPREEQRVQLLEDLLIVERRPVFLAGFQEQTQDIGALGGLGAAAGELRIEEAAQVFGRAQLGMRSVKPIGSKSPCKFTRMLLVGPLGKVVMGRVPSIVLLPLFDADDMLARPPAPGRTGRSAALAGRRDLAHRGGERATGALMLL